MRDKLDHATWITAALILVPFGLFLFPQFLGFSESYIVRSDSMTPDINPGDVIFVNSADPSEISTGDVISFRENGEGVVITHRVSEVQRFAEETQFKTRGDSNPDADPEWVADYQVIGKVGLTIPNLGRVVEVANVGMGRMAIIIIPSILLVLNELRNIMKSAESNKALKLL